MCVNHLHSFEPYAAREVIPESSGNVVREGAGVSLFLRVYFDCSFLPLVTEKGKGRRDGIFFEILYPRRALEEALGVGG